jgi:hypothetical protein
MIVYRLVFTLQRFFIKTVMLVLLTGIFLPCFSQCSNASLNAYTISPLRLSSFNDLLNGGTAQNYVHAQINLTSNVNCPRWSLSVRAISNFKNGSSEVDVKYTSIKFNSTAGGPSGGSIGISGAPFVLSKNETFIISNSNSALNSQSFNTMDIRYDFIVQGGNQLFVPINGDYQTTLVFTLYDEAKRVISTSSTLATFQIYYDPNYTSNVILQNGASNISLAFSSAADFTNGVTDLKTDGLSVHTYSAHQVIVKAATSVLTAPGISTTLPVSIIKLTLSTKPAQSAVVCNSVQLSASSQVVATNRLTDYTYQTVLYTLRFFIAGNNSSISSAPPGVYSTSIVFVIVPL